MNQKHSSISNENPRKNLKRKLEELQQTASQQSHQEPCISKFNFLSFFSPLFFVLIFNVYLCCVVFVDIC
jgi:hypothetical protein